MKIEKDERLVSFRIPMSLLTKVKLLAVLKKTTLQDYYTEAIAHAVESEQDVLKEMKLL